MNARQNPPNDALRAVRIAMRLSQDEFAGRLREAGIATANKRLVQRYESGEITAPRPATARALEMVTKLPLNSLGFPDAADRAVVDDGRGGHDLEVRASALPAALGPPRPAGNYTGIWLSTYEYFSSTRKKEYEGTHYVVMLQHDDRLTVRSINGPERSLLTMDLVVDGSVVTGTWTEVTAVDGFYRGARYHGAIQMLAEPTARRITGKWVGFGKSMDVNTGPWTLSFVTASTSKAMIAEYGAPPA